MNRSIYFPAFVFLLLFALLLLFSDLLSRFSTPHSMLESGKASDRMAVEKATLTNPHAVGLFTDPVEIRVSANDQRTDSFVGSALNKVTRKLRGVPSHLTDHVHPSFSAKIVSRYRPTANLVTRIHSWLVGELGLAHTANGQSIKKRLTSRRLAAAVFKAHGQN